MPNTSPNSVFEIDLVNGHAYIKLFLNFQWRMCANMSCKGISLFASGYCDLSLIRAFVIAKLRCVIAWKKTIRYCPKLPWGGSKGYLSGSLMSTLNMPFSNGESGGPKMMASRSLMESSFSQHETPAGGPYAKDIKAIEHHFASSLASQGNRRTQLD